MRFFLTFLCVCISLSICAQTLPNFSIKGIVIDSATNRSLDYVTISIKAMDNKPLKTTLTKGDGTFEFQKLAAGTYKISVIAVGYQSKAFPVTLDTVKVATDLGRIVITAVSTALKEVTVMADKPLVKQEIDRIGYDVQSDPDSKSQTVIEMLQKVPLVSVDGDDNIRVKGSTKFKILINGRPSSLVARSPKDVFKSMSASSIQKIEVITTPPAKYDSEGLAGILNIITNKKIDNGYNGGIGLGLNYPHGPGTFFFFYPKRGEIWI